MLSGRLTTPGGQKQNKKNERHCRWLRRTSCVLASFAASPCPLHPRVWPYSRPCYGLPALHVAASLAPSAFFARLRSRSSYRPGFLWCCTLCCFGPVPPRSGSVGVLGCCGVVGLEVSGCRPLPPAGRRVICGSTSSRIRECWALGIVLTPVVTSWGCFPWPLVLPACAIFGCSVGAT